MKFEGVLYPKELLKENGPYFEMRLHLTEEEILSLISSLTSAIHEYRTKGIECEVPRDMESVSQRRASGAERKPQPIICKGRLIIRVDRPKR